MKEDVVCLRADDPYRQLAQLLLEVAPLLCNQLAGAAQVIGVGQGGNTGNLCRDRNAPRLTQASHPLQQRRVSTQAVAQPQSCHRKVLGEGAQNQQVGEFFHPALHAVAVAVLQKVAETFVHHQQCAAGGAADQNPLQQLLVDQLSGRIVWVAQKDDAGVRMYLFQHRIVQHKVLLLFEQVVFDAAGAAV